MLQYRPLQEQELCRDLFQSFIRRQVVTKCWRKDNGTSSEIRNKTVNGTDNKANDKPGKSPSSKWVIKDAPFIDDWTESDYQVLISCLKNTLRTGGFVYAAFLDGALKGFVSVEAGLFGGGQKYLDLSSIHVSADMRHKGIGKELFIAAKRWAKAQGAGKLYISAHSAVESQAFYRKMGCVEAEEYNEKHVEAEPFDCQLECIL